MVRKILEEKVLSIPEVKEVLSGLEKKVGRENFDSFQESTMVYVEKFSKADADRARKIKEMIINDYQLDEIKASIIVNIMPLTVPEMRTVFEKDQKAAKLSNKDIEDMIKKIKDILK